MTNQILQGANATLSTNTSLLVEIFSRFLCRLLEKDPNYDTYSKEWNEFKEHLLKEPLDLDKIFLHIATIHLNMEKMHQSKESSSRPSLESICPNNNNINLQRIQTMPEQKPMAPPKPYNKQYSVPVSINDNVAQENIPCRNSTPGSANNIPNNGKMINSIQSPKQKPTLPRPFTPNSALQPVTFKIDLMSQFNKHSINTSNPSQKSTPQHAHTPSLDIQKKTNTTHASPGAFTVDEGIYQALKSKYGSPQPSRKQQYYEPRPVSQASNNTTVNYGHQNTNTQLSGQSTGTGSNNNSGNSQDDDTPKQQFFTQTDVKSITSSPDAIEGRIHTQVNETSNKILAKAITNNNQNKDNNIKAGTQSPQQPSSFVDNTPPPFQKQASGGYVPPNLNINNLIGKQPNMSILKEKAKNMRRDIFSHSEEIIGSIAKGKRMQAPSAQQDDRSQLRRVSVYSRQPTVKDLRAIGNAIDQTAVNPYPKTLPGGSIIIRE